MLSLDRQAAVLKDADGQLRGHLSDRRTEEGKKAFIACGESCILQDIYGNLQGHVLYVCVCMSVCLCKCLFVQCFFPPLSEAQWLNVTLPPWHW